MASSPTYNWPEPDNTDLVKNGALAIRTLGNAIDTTMATMTPKSTFTAKGSIAAATAASTPANLAVGNNGESLVADSSTATGLRYNPTQAAGKNVLINGAFDIWQRGTSFASGVNPNPFFIADRWQATRSGNASGATISRQTSGAPTGFQYYVRLQRDSGNTATQGINLAQCVESSMSIPYAGQAVTFSFYARAGATYSSSAGNVTVKLQTGTGTDQNNFSSSYTGLASAVDSTATVTTSWQRFSYTVTLASTVTEFEPLIITTHTGTAGATDYIDVTGVQIELGSVATAFTRAGGTIQGELAACQRYYYRQTGTASIGLSQLAGIGYSGTQASLTLPTKVSMRVAPTTLDYSGVRLSDETNVIALSSLAILSANTTTDFVYLVATAASGVVQYRPYAISMTASASNYVGWSAEL